MTRPEDHRALAAGSAQEAPSPGHAVSAGQRTYEGFVEESRAEVLRRVEAGYQEFLRTRTFAFPRWLYGEPLGTLFAVACEDCPTFGESCFLEFDSGRSALVVIDMQVDFCGSGGYVDVMGYPLENTAQAIAPTRRCIDAVRGTDIRVIHTREGHLPDLSDAPYNKLLRSKIIGKGVGIGEAPDGGLGRLLVRGQKNWDIVEELYPIAGEIVVEKAGKGGLETSTLFYQLANLGVRHLIITGITADVCVRSIMAQANDLGFWCLLLKDATGATDAGNYNALIKMVKMQGGVFGWVSTSLQFVAALEQAGLAQDGRGAPRDPWGPATLMTPISIKQAMEIALGHHQAGRLAEAEEIYREILAQSPDHAGALHLLGALACQAGLHETSIELIGRAIAIDPSAAEFHNDRGESYRRSGRPEEAIAGFQRAIELKPGMALAHSNLANALWGLGRLDEAIIAARRAIALAPGFAEAWNNLGNALKDKECYEEAIGVLRRATELKPDSPAVHNNLGCALIARGDLEESIAAFGRALVLRPDLAEAYNNLGTALKEAGRLDEALASFRRALAVNPTLAAAGSSLLYALHFDPGQDARSILAEHRAWAGRFAEPLAAEIGPHKNDRTPDRRLRVGFVSPDFRDHALGRAILPLFAHHDRRQFEFVAYSDTQVRDGITTTLEALADRWCHTTALSDRQLAERIRGDRCDLLVDLALHTAGNRLLVFARKPAPVQVTMLGLPATTGLATIDFRLTDPYLDPPGTSEGDYTERSIRLPHCFWCYQPADDAPPVGALPALRNGYLTFGCLNQFAKVSRPALQVWVKILQSLPGSRLVIHAPPGSHRNAVHGLFQDGGIGPERIEFVPRLARLPYLCRYHDLDLCLDPFPYNGGISTMDSLWMGVPVITLASRTAVGRAGVSVLENVGLAELIARTPDHYAKLAVDWAGDLTRLSQIRSGLRKRMQSSPLMDGKQYAAAVEAAIRKAWQTWCDRT